MMLESICLLGWCLARAPDERAIRTDRCGVISCTDDGGMIVSNFIIDLEGLPGGWAAIAIQNVNRSTSHGPALIVVNMACGAQLSLP